MDKLRLYTNRYGLVVLLAAVIVVFLPVRGFEFINLDDDEYITANAPVLSGLTAESIAWAFSRFHSGHWHPVTWISHMSDVSLFGLDGGGSSLSESLASLNEFTSRFLSSVSGFPEAGFGSIRRSLFLTSSAEG